MRLIIAVIYYCIISQILYKKVVSEWRNFKVHRSKFETVAILSMVNLFRFNLRHSILLTQPLDLNYNKNTKCVFFLSFTGSLLALIYENGVIRDLPLDSEQNPRQYDIVGHKTYHNVAYAQSTSHGLGTNETCSPTQVRRSGLEYYLHDGSAALQELQGAVCGVDTTDAKDGEARQRLGNGGYRLERHRAHGVARHSPVGGKLLLPYARVRRPFAVHLHQSLHCVDCRHTVCLACCTR